jgi:uncharacterized DUF497 family protein
MMDEEPFEWDPEKAAQNLRKHGVTFSDARMAFEDPLRLVQLDAVHSVGEQRYYCVGRVGNGVLTVRFTIRGQRVRIFGAGYWRKGRRQYEKANQIHG